MQSEYKQARMQRSAVNHKKADQIEKLSDKELVDQLKLKGLESFGTKHEKIDRLKRHFGIFEELDTKKKADAKSSCVKEIEKMKKKREERREKDSQKRQEITQLKQANEAAGKFGDVEYELMIAQDRLDQALREPHSMNKKDDIDIIIRKRPIFEKEQRAGENDVISCANPHLCIHECKFKVDGITKAVETHRFAYDHVFDEHDSNEKVYKYSLGRYLDVVCNGGILTCFAYGQTGSGKTYTMQGIESMAMRDLFRCLQTKESLKKVAVCINFVEVFGEKVYDLLNEKALVKTMEDKNGVVQFQGLSEVAVKSAEELLKTMERGFSLRTTQSTVNNDESSRSHAICMVLLRDEAATKLGKLVLVDLAGNERAADTQKNDKHRKAEGAQINSSLLALKECIRAMDEARRGGAAVHVPFRQSKLTLALRDSFVEPRDGTASKMIMIGCVSPGSSFTDYSLNTLWYASKIAGQRRTAASKYTNAAYHSSISLNSSQLMKGRQALNASFEEKEKKSLQPATENARKRLQSSDSDSLKDVTLTNTLAVEPTPPQKKPSAKSLASSQQHIARPFGSRAGLPGKKPKEEKKEPAGSQAEADKKDKSKEEPMKSAVTKDHFDPEEVFTRYIDSLKWESEVIRQESKLIADAADDWEKSFREKKAAMVGLIESKIGMLKKLQSLISEC